MSVCIPWQQEHIWFQFRCRFFSSTSFLALTAENISRVDLQLESDRDDDDSDSDDAEKIDHINGDATGRDDSKESVPDESLLTDQPTIQIQFAVGNMDDNPMMKILAGGDSDESDDDASSGASSNKNEDISRKRAVEDLLLRMSTEERSQECPTKKKSKPLITELSWTSSAAWYV